MISASVARFRGSISSIRLMTLRDSRGSSLNRRQGPLIVSGLASVEEDAGLLSEDVAGLSPPADASTFAFPCSVDSGVIACDRRRWTLSAAGVPGVGVAANSRYELSVSRGIFHGNRRSDMHANMIARLHTSVGRGS